MATRACEWAYWRIWIERERMREGEYRETIELYKAEDRFSRNQNMYSDGNESATCKFIYDWLTCSFQCPELMDRLHL